MKRAIPFLLLTSLSANPNFEVQFMNKYVDKGGYRKVDGFTLRKSADIDLGKFNFKAERYTGLFGTDEFFNSFQLKREFDNFSFGYKSTRGKEGVRDDEFELATHQLGLDWSLNHSKNFGTYTAISKTQKLEFAGFRADYTVSTSWNEDYYSPKSGFSYIRQKIELDRGMWHSIFIENQKDLNLSNMIRDETLYGASINIKF